MIFEDKCKIQSESAVGLVTLAEKQSLVVTRYGLELYTFEIYILASEVKVDLGGQRS